MWENLPDMSIDFYKYERKTGKIFGCVEKVSNFSLWKITCGNLWEMLHVVSEFFERGYISGELKP